VVAALVASVLTLALQVARFTELSGYVATWWLDQRTAPGRAAQLS
jgi:hypothetical protein